MTLRRSTTLLMLNKEKNLIPFTKNIASLRLHAPSWAVFAVPLWILGHSIIMCKHLHDTCNPQVLHQTWVIIIAFVGRVPAKGSKCLDN